MRMHSRSIIGWLFLVPLIALLVGNSVATATPQDNQIRVNALKKFRASEGWQAGVDGTVAVVSMGAEGSIDTTKIKEPIVGFVFGQKGLMTGASIEGSKFTKLKK